MATRISTGTVVGSIPSDSERKGQLALGLSFTVELRGGEYSPNAWVIDQLSSPLA